MKPEDVTREQLFATVKSHCVDIAELTLKNEPDLTRYKNSNHTSERYIDYPEEFVTRGLVWTPKIEK